MHWLEVGGIVLAMALGRVWDSRFAHPKIKKERNEELDGRLKTLRDGLGLAISTGHQSLSHELTTLSSDLRTVKGTVDSMAGDVKGLKDRELGRLESDAREGRRQAQARKR